jgi:hypothetical protein
MMNPVRIGNGLFVIASLIFTSDCVIDVLEEVSLHSLSEMIAGLTFSIGSLLMITSTQSE